MGNWTQRILRKWSWPLAGVGACSITGRIYIWTKKHRFDADTLSCCPSHHKYRGLVPFSNQGAALSGSTVYQSRIWFKTPTCVCMHLFYDCFFLRGDSDGIFYLQNSVEWEKSHNITARRLDSRTNELDHYLVSSLVYDYLLRWSGLF